jgi:hypothetical protein
MSTVLTIVVVTQPGREYFFELLLQSISKALTMFENIRVLIVLNGASTTSKSIAQNFKESFPQRIRIKHFEENSVLPDCLWKILIEENISWAHFPGDDDIVIPENYSEFFHVVEQYPKTIAVPFEAAVINKHGNLTGKKLFPGKFTGVPNDFLLASAFHKPPFVWPSVIFNLKFIPGELFLSRYVFDWWVSLNLICLGEIRSVDKTLVKYRIHHGQESQKSSEFRKRFEAVLMITGFIQSEVFISRLKSISSIPSFVISLERNLPIYGDVVFGVPILLSVLEKLHSVLKVDPHISGMSLSEYFIRNGVPMTSSELPRYSWCRNSLPNSLNFQLRIMPDTCLKLQSIVKPLFSNHAPIIGVLGCRHVSEVSKSSVFLDCYNAEDRSESDILNELLLSTQLVLHDQRLSYNSLAPWELLLLKKVRQFLRVFRRIKIFFIRN